MKFKLYFLVAVILHLFLFTAKTTIAQESIKISWGEEFQLKSQFKPVGTHISSTGDIYTLYESMLYESMVYVTKMDIFGNLIATEEYKLEYDGIDLFFQRFISTPEKCGIVSSFYNRVQKKSFLFIKHLNEQSSRFDGELKLIFEMEGDIHNRDESFNELVPAFLTASSPDSSKYLISCKLQTADKEPRQFQLLIFDEQLSILSSTRVTFPLTSEYIISSWGIDNMGDVYFLVKTKGTHRTGNLKDSKFEYAILFFNSKDGTGKTMPIDAEKKYFSNLNMIIDLNNIATVGGYFSLIKNSSLHGVYYGRFNMRDDKILISKFTNYNLKFLVGGQSKKKIQSALEEKKFRELNIDGYKLKKIMLDDYANLLISGENILHYSSNKNSYDLYKDAIVSKVDTLGNVIWNVRFPKNQYETPDGLFLQGDISSYSLFSTPDKTFFVYWEDSERLTRKTQQNELKSYSTISIGELIIESINNAGEVSRQVIPNKKDDNFNISPAKYLQLANGNILIYKFKSKVFKQGLMFLN